MIVDYKEVSVKHGDHQILESVSLQIDEGEFVYLIGRVGSGKSTLLKTMYGEVDIESGQASVLDFDLRKIKRSKLQNLRKKLGIVFQNFQLMMDRTVAQNLDFVLRATGWNKSQERKERIKQVLTMVGMPIDCARLMPYMLSGGEQQRICIARALLNSPKLILADEPTGNLDSETTLQTIQLLKDIAEKNNTTVLLSTHNELILKQFPGRVLKVENMKVLDMGNENNSISFE